MKHGVIGAFVSLLVVAGSAVAPAQTREVRVVGLDANPSPSSLAEALEAYHSGDIVRMIGGTPADLQRLLGVRVTGPQQEPDTPRVLAVRVAPNGALHQFIAGMRRSSDGAELDWSSAFTAWMERELNGGGSARIAAVGDPGPPAEVWTELWSTTVDTKDQWTNGFQTVVTVFRLNDTSTQFDWYMVLNDPVVQPNWGGCGYDNCGWFTAQKVTTISTTPPPVALFDWGPHNLISVTTAGFNIGGTLTNTQGGISAAFSETWQQPSVTTTDQSTPTSTKIAKWEEDFQGTGAWYRTPPLTSTGVFASHQGAIFQVPDGASFQLNVDNAVTSEVDHFWYDPNQSFGGGGVYLAEVSPPLFIVEPQILTIPAGSKDAILVTATIPSTVGTPFGLPWVVEGEIPQWLGVSQVSGSGSTQITLTVAPGTATGTTAFLNLDTSPKFAAPSVTVNPLKVQVTVGPRSNPTGVLLVGGFVSGNPLQTADLFDTSNDQIVPVGPLVVPRDGHTATLLGSGQLLVTGGTSGPNVLASAELFDPSTATFSAVQGQTSCPGSPGCMTTRRRNATATLLRNGKVLIVGGQDANSNALNSAELYDPAAQTFTATGSMATPRLFHSATLLPSGDVLVAGGVSNPAFPNALNSAEIYHIGTGAFAATGNLVTARFDHTATLLGTGEVLLAGGRDSNSDPTASAELFNEKGTFSATRGTLQKARTVPRATLLQNQKVVLIGGFDLGGAMATAELYDPDHQTFALLSGTAQCPGNPGCMNAARFNHTSTLLLDGRVFVAGGRGQTVALGSSEFFDPNTGTFGVGPQMPPRAFHTASLLQRPSTTTSLTASPNPSPHGQAVVFIASVEPAGAGGSVSFKEGTGTLGTVPVTNGQAKLSVTTLAVGPHTIVAVYEGDAGHAPSKSAPWVQTVTKSSSETTLTSSLNPSEFGQLVTFTATATGGSGTPTGAVTFRDGSRTLASDVKLVGGKADLPVKDLVAGAHGIVATYSGDADFSGSVSQPLTQQVKAAATVASVTSSANPSLPGQSVKFEVTVAATAGAGGTPLGYVTVYANSITLAEKVSLSEGKASVTTDKLTTAGTYAISATYHGSADFPGSTSPRLIQTVDRASTVTTITSASPNPSTFGQPVTFVIAVTSSGGGTPTGSLTVTDVTGNRVLASPVGLGSDGKGRTTTDGDHRLAVGANSITATYEGDANYLPSTSSPISVRVNAASSSTE